MNYKLSLFFLISLFFFSCFKEAKIKVKTDYPIAIKGFISNKEQIIEIVRIPDNDLNSESWSVSDAVVYLENDLGEVFLLNYSAARYTSKFLLDIHKKWRIVFIIGDEVIQDDIFFSTPTHSNEFYAISTETALNYFFKINDENPENHYSSLRILGEIDGKFDLGMRTNSNILPYKTCKPNVNDKRFEKTLSYVITDREMYFDYQFFSKRFQTGEIIDEVWRNANAEIIGNSLVNLFVFNVVEDTIQVEDISKQLISIQIKDISGSLLDITNSNKAIIKYDSIFFTWQDRRRYNVGNIDTIKSNPFSLSLLQANSRFMVCRDSDVIPVNGMDVSFSINISDGVNNWIGKGNFDVSESLNIVDVIVHKK